jgi:hypothetical protein
MCDDLRLLRTICRQRHKFVDGFVPAFVPFTHTYDRSSVGSNATVGIPQTSRLRRLRSDGTRSRPRIDAVEALILEVREKDGVVPEEICATSIFMDPGPRVVIARQEVHRRSCRGRSHDDDTAGLIGAALQPIQIAVGKLELAEPDAG